MQFDYDYPASTEFDSDVKIPGRHMPKLPYFHPSRDDFASPSMHTFGGDHRSSKSHHTYHQQHNNYQQDYKYYQPSYRNQQSNYQYSQPNDYQYDSISQRHFPTRITSEGVEHLTPHESDNPPVRRTVSYGSKHSRLKLNSIQEDTPPGLAGPSFDRSLPRNVTVQVGKTAILSCRVLNRGSKTVSK